MKPGLDTGLLVVDFDIANAGNEEVVTYKSHHPLITMYDAHPRPAVPAICQMSLLLEHIASFRAQLGNL